MSNILVFIQHDNGNLTKGSLISLSAAQSLKATWNKNKLVTLCLGTAAEKAAEEVLEYGIDQALYCNQPEYDKYIAAHYAEALKAAFSQESCDTLIGVATSHVKDLFPRFTALVDGGQASDILAVNSDGSLKRPMYAGDILADVEITCANKVVSVRSTAFQPAVKSQRSGMSKALTLSTTSICGEVVAYEISKGGRPELTDAEVVVSGGRAMQSSENFEKVIFPLADALGAAVGASRAAVDAGYAPNDWQVGQTGKIVAPSLYIAVGISGAIQHLAGMKDSKTIVAINKDADAPIYEVADYGLVADLYDVVPKLTEAIKKIKA